MGKGSRRERQAVDIFKAAGWATYRPATVQYGENDVFGLFDILAVHPDWDRPRAVQVKANANRGIMAWRDHTWLFRRTGFATDYLVCYDNSGWQLSAVTDAEHRTLVDERGTDCTMGELVTDYLTPDSRR